MYYYRDIDKKEIDLILTNGNKLFPIEIKKSKAPNHADKNFDVLGKLGMDIQPGIIMCLTDEMIPYNRDIWYFPIYGL